MTDAEAHKQSLAQLQPLQPATCTLFGRVLDCLAGSATRSKQLNGGGFTLAADLVLFVDPVLFSSTELDSLNAGAKVKLTHRGHSYRIEEAVTPVGDPFLKLICVDASRGA